METKITTASNDLNPRDYSWTGNPMVCSVVLASWLESQAGPSINTLRSQWYVGEKESSTDVGALLMNHLSVVQHP